MNDADFLDYCYWHSKTARAGFVAEHVARILRLAGEEERAAKFDGLGASIHSVPSDVMHPLVKTARDRLIASPLNAYVMTVEAETAARKALASHTVTSICGDRQLDVTEGDGVTSSPTAEPVQELHELLPKYETLLSEAQAHVVSSNEVIAAMPNTTRAIIEGLLKIVASRPAAMGGEHDVIQKAQDFCGLFVMEPSEETGEVVPHLDRHFPDYNDTLTALIKAVRALTAPRDAGAAPKPVHHSQVTEGFSMTDIDIVEDEACPICLAPIPAVEIDGAS